SVPGLPGWRRGLKGRRAGSDPLPINPQHSFPISGPYRLNNQAISHICLARYVVGSYHALTFAQANMILRRIPMESKNETASVTADRNAVKALKAHLALNVRDVSQSIE